MSILPTISLSAAAVRLWDVVVVGAGPAGALAAYELAGRGHSVLVIDKAAFPRWKVCGSCLNGHALGILQQVGLAAIPSRLGAVPLRQFWLASERRSAHLKLSSGAVVSRAAFDAALLIAALEAGAAFLPEVRASSSWATPAARTVRVQRCAHSSELCARIVLVASGLGATSILPARENYRNRQPRRIGLGIVVPDGPAFYAPGTIYMACAAEGYLGAVRLEDGRLDIAAALDPQSLRGGPAEAARKVLASAGFPAIRAADDGAWRGTPLLTRRPAQVAATRLFAIGDAAGYIEPFTGEGIAWALASAQAVVPLVGRGVDAWKPGLVVEWSRLHWQTVGRGQLVCRVLAELLRQPVLARALVDALASAPWLATPFVYWMNRCHARRTETEDEPCHSRARNGPAGTRHISGTSGRGREQTLLPHAGAGHGAANAVSPVRNCAASLRD